MEGNYGIWDNCLKMYKANTKEKTSNQNKRMNGQSGGHIINLGCIVYLLLVSEIV